MHSNTARASQTTEGRLWLVTGASSGIGRAIALQLAAAGQQVIAWGRDANRLAELQSQSAGIVSIQTVDLAATEELAGLAQSCAKQWPQLSGLIHCAGIQHDVLMTDSGYDAAAISEELRINLAAPMELTRALLPHLHAQRCAVVVLVSSALAFAPKRRAATYNASKAGLHAFAQSLRAQLRNSGVRVLELIPPLVDTPMTAGRGRRKLSPDAVAQALLRQLSHSRLRERIWVGPARALPWLLRLAPHSIQSFFLG
ncbi:SDR family oxidoreductase [Paucibacter sp. Y2R2-4]|uniref:SDR family oxidoreductase n=1 Tax=Paucibacter sp. Y2R2-4 TaxID=2893553 RepID=UPI0021E39303|nr:SDR family NAD(P)-dependent oxidoreductase [Paucibacter sp. Y2R2-4]MCV2351671.1 SDR family NAD(P)-dependent oxidoreductase [Paucibacter sp. Y2R2-4]